MHSGWLYPSSAHITKKTSEISLVRSELTVVFATFRVGKLRRLKTRTYPNRTPDSITIIEPSARAPARAAFIQNVSHTVATNVNITFGSSYSIQSKVVLRTVVDEITKATSPVDRSLESTTTIVESFSRKQSLP